MVGCTTERQQVLTACAEHVRAAGFDADPREERDLAGSINPGRVFDFETDLEHVVDGYRAMDERRAVKAIVRVGAAG